MAEGVEDTCAILDAWATPLSAPRLTSETDVKEAAVRQAGLATGRRPMPELTIFVELVDTIIVVAEVTPPAALNMPERRDGCCSSVKQPRDDLCEVGSVSLIDDVVLQAPSSSCG